MVLSVCSDAGVFRHARGHAACSQTPSQLHGRMLRGRDNRITVNASIHWEYPSSCRPMGMGCWSVGEHMHALQAMLMAYPNQAGSL